MRYELDKGGHSRREDGMCAMEWVAFLAGEVHTDAPICVAPDLVDFFITLNDKMQDKERQLLRPYLARTIGTRESVHGFQPTDVEWMRRVGIYREIFERYDEFHRDYSDSELSESVAAFMVQYMIPWTPEFKETLEHLLPTVQIDTSTLVAEACPILQAA